MSASAPTQSHPPTVAVEGDRAYLGYRWRGVASVRLPSGAYVAVPPRSERALAGVVLRDRLGRAPETALLDRFRREWVSHRAHGEFVWPVAAIDEWLDARDAHGVATASPRKRQHETAPTGLIASARRAFRAPLTPQFRSTPSPRGGH